jgi:hypothetical protein
MSYERIGSGGLGWSELGFMDRRASIICEGSPSRQICFIDNDPLEQSTAERAGCVRSRRPTRAPWSWIAGETITECLTDPGGNRGHIWCCPDNAPQPITTTPEQRARDTELLLAEQRAAQEGRLPSTTAPSEVEKEPTIEVGRTQPMTQQETLTSVLAKVAQNPGWIVAVAVVGLGGYLAFRYFLHGRGAMSLARLR